MPEIDGDDERSALSMIGSINDRIYQRSDLLWMVCAGVPPVQNDLTGVAGAHDGECLLMFPPGEVMRNDGRDIEAAL